jgi:glycosyltransferase involved in cell wall biosynthesis
MITDLPRILLVSEVTLSKEGKGVNRTLFNLFENYPPELFMVFAPHNYFISEPTSPPFDRQVASFPGYYGIRRIPNRIGKLINPLIDVMNLQLLDWLPIANQKRLEAFDPEIILVCPATVWSLVMAHKVTNQFQVPFLIYFMDDWVGNKNFRWLSGSLQASTYELLKSAAGWLMISEQLQEILSSRYQLSPKQSLIVHNPVDLSGKQPPNLKPTNLGKLKVAYAGSIWQMHYDALAAVAEAIFDLRRDGEDIELILYTDKFFWNLYQEQWNFWQVNYGGLIPYQEINDHLKSADLLLVTSSFLPEYAGFSRSSVQTKLTDYMAAGTPIISCGPDYSACNQFIKKWNCGIICETNVVSEIKKFLLQISNDRYLLNTVANQGFATVKQYFEKGKVSLKLYKFIKDLQI